ncbi:MAG: glycosyl hydrolase [Bacteroidota bacterium]
MRKTSFLLLALCLSLPLGTLAQKKKKKNQEAEEAKSEYFLKGSHLGAFKFRSVGPALTSGRIADFAVNPANRFEYYVAVASGGVWKTINNGTTYQPVFDSQGSYSVGCITMDPNNSNVIWVGTGENNGQRSVAYGDGVYKSSNGGATWKNVGLKNSEHIGMITVDPRNSNRVFVAAQGPLWSEGGDRGLYLTEDGGESWEKVLEIDEHTGVSEVLMDPRNPDVMYATSWQRRRHVWTFISGGPGSALYKSTDGGKTWHKSQKGLPGGDLGRIGLTISPANPDVVYAIVESSGKKGGFYRSQDQGVSWKRMNDYATSGNYYQEIVADPVDVDRVVSLNTYAMLTVDGGKTWKRLGEKSKHVDNHALYIDPDHPSYHLMGCDGGIYESYDSGKNWIFKPNLPVTQFYKVSTDNAEPFYHIYGGTQDNWSMGGPSRTINAHGIMNQDWYTTNGGDGFESQVDPTNPNIVYAQAQYGWLVRHDKQSGESVPIQPQPDKDEAAYRWNWDAPLLISPHNPKRLYFAANKVFRSDDQGNTWKTISGDLSRQLDRNTLPVMGKVWSMDAVAKNISTTIYGNIVALDESPVQEDLLYIGTDDGLIHISENAGGAWRKVEGVAGVPERTYVNMLLASQHDVNTVYAAFNNHKMGDFMPYLYKSTDKGQTWTSIANNLPERGSVYAIAEDHVDPNLLFAGTEFGLFVSLDGGAHWTQMRAGLPTIAIRDIAIQKRENDLVLASFGRGFYVLDNYAPLRSLDEEALTAEAHIFPIKDAWMFNQATPVGGYGKAFQGESFFTAPNPPVGTVIRYHFKDPIKTLKQIRKDKEKELAKAGEPIPYPSFEEMRAEDNEEKPYLLFTITDGDDNVVRRIKTAASTGMKSITWDFRYPSTYPVNPKRDGRGYMALPGTYYVSLSKVVNGEATELVGKQSFNIKPLDNVTLPADDRAEVVAFMGKAAELQRSVSAASAMTNDLKKRMDYLKAAVRNTPDVPLDMLGKIKEIEQGLQEISLALNGDPSLSRRQFETVPSVSGRVGRILWGLGSSSSAIPTEMKEQYEIAGDLFEPVMEQLEGVVSSVQKLEKELEAMGAPYTPGRMPSWNRE